MFPSFRRFLFIYLLKKKFFLTPASWLLLELLALLTQWGPIDVNVYFRISQGAFEFDIVSPSPFRRGKYFYKQLEPIIF